ncbi:hypothetical protein HK405_000240 [Cladochytrium tenue]|nr:hypothetical protein HK405_000240 [Cladochytrium tenue]
MVLHGRLSPAAATTAILAAAAVVAAAITVSTVAVVAADATYEESLLVTFFKFLPSCEQACVSSAAGGRNYTDNAVIADYLCANSTESKFLSDFVQCAATNCTDLTTADEQSSDISIDCAAINAVLYPSSTTTTSTATATPSSSSSSTNSSSVNSTTGKDIGIGAAVILAILILVAVRRHYSRRRQQRYIQSRNPEPLPPPPPLLPEQYPPAVISIVSGEPARLGVYNRAPLQPPGATAAVGAETSRLGVYPVAGVPAYYPAGAAESRTDVGNQQHESRYPPPRNTNEVEQPPLPPFTE